MAQLVLSQRGKALSAVVEELLELLEGAVAPVDPAWLDGLQRRFDAASLTAGAGLARPDSALAVDAQDAQLTRASTRRDELEREIAGKDQELQRRVDALRMFRMHLDVLAEATMPAACDQPYAAELPR
jgi:hypothetical protein